MSRKIDSLFSKPIKFVPIFQKRLWGGQRLSHWGRTLPENQTIGESWELVDREEACNGITQENEASSYQTLHDLWRNERRAIFGTKAPITSRFPILIKLLDCKDVLSVQVHPPASVAKKLNAEPKTELWYFLETEENAVIYAGLKKGVTRETFENAIGSAHLSQLLHSMKTAPGEAMFLPSGRVHAIGAGNLILEIQQNSDTTYRVYDWLRVDDLGNPRQLHIKEAMQCIQFNDFEPCFSQPHGDTIINCPFFKVQRHWLLKEETLSFTPTGETFYFQFISRGNAHILETNTNVNLGEAWLLPASASRITLEATSDDFEIISIAWGD
jgi:mannose-6-phosphate isomerase